MCAVCIYVHACTRTCACEGLKLISGIILIHHGRVSHSNLELTNTAGLASQLALGILCVSLLGLELYTDSHVHI